MASKKSPQTASGSMRSSNLADVLFPSEDEIDLQDSILDIPPEQRRLHTETVDYNVQTIVEALKASTIKIPEFQRRYVWTNSQASRLIESLIIQCPIPIVYLSQGTDEVYNVIDGNQRLSSLRRFLNNEFRLTGLTAYPELEGNSYQDLDPRFQRHIVNRTIRCLIILKDTHPQVKFDVFERLNSGAVKLTPQELRHGIYHGDVIKLAEKCAGDSTFKKMASISGENKRMKLEELVLRFWALQAGLTTYRKPLSDFINRFCEKNRTIPSSKQEELVFYFDETIARVTELFGDLAFSVFDKNQIVQSRFNAAVFDCQMVGTANLVASNRFKKHSRKQASILMTQLFENTSFMKMISKATSDDGNVKGRIRDFTKKFEA